jgi:hypothetical protein
MVQLKPSGAAIAQPKPKYGYLSEIGPEFAPLREETDKDFAALWSLPLAEFKVAWLNAPIAVPDDAPQPGKRLRCLRPANPRPRRRECGLEVLQADQPG